MFVVIVTGGEYDEKWTDVRVCSTDRSKLERYIVEQQAERDARQAFQLELRNLHTLTAANFPMRAPTLQRKERKAWPTGLGQARFGASSVWGKLKSLKRCVMNAK